ncbi:phenylalanine--tRNA ligase subunit alpha [Candidatus Woesearchaeota archaeon]|nr:phenylalanine--tRNA ligase subunit alpha [Candidatus Woesearchaeota archaeon]
MADLKKIIEGLHPLERKTLPALAGCSSLPDITAKTKLKEVEVMRALQWLENKGILKIKKGLKEVVVLDKNGKEYLEKGLPEKRVLKALTKGDILLGDVVKKAGIEPGEFNVSLGVLKKKAAILIDGKTVKITEPGKKFLEKESFEEKLLKKLSEREVELKELKDEEKFAFDNLSKRKQIIKSSLLKLVGIELTELGKKAANEKISEGKTADRLTASMLKTGAWKGKTFRRYDVKINVPEITGAKRHFISQAVEYIRKIWIEMGFKEMKGSLVQTAFWDLDALFVPQDHPARQMQDTYYLKDPAAGKLPSPLWKKVKEVHENGGDTGSKGWGGKWSEEAAKQNLLRTHTTVLSAQTISALKESDLPAKFFSVAKVFRNEALDWKHLFELTQVEGIVVDPKANMKYLKGYLKEFFAKMGYPDVRIRPGHFPYTEPSAEVDVLHPEKNEWIELGGSGIFRPEVVKPLLGIEVPVLAWGLGMERTVSEYFKINDIRELYKNDLRQIRNMKTWMR